MGRPSIALLALLAIAGSSRGAPADDATGLGPAVPGPSVSSLEAALRARSSGSRAGTVRSAAGGVLEIAPHEAGCPPLRLRLDAAIPLFSDGRAADAASLRAGADVNVFFERPAG